MPHINRIRVNNVKYNFGTQFYDDFILRFDGKNTLYDLANGGGKSVLMLLLFQNLIPNCTLDDKQPIEKLFRTSEGSTTIHSLVEWKLDDGDVEDGYRYMLTGFCARKAKSAEDEPVVRDTASIDYFNYVIFYREYNENDLVNLPLSRGKERMTYTGLRSYLKELEHKDYSLKLQVFDRKGAYQQFIAGYGLYESQWEIIRGINKTEGHVRTYFETNYRTTRKVVEDLLIEGIIQKAYLSKTGGESEDMAGTLMNIRDKLLELSKKRQEMSGYDHQAEALESFSGRVSSLHRLYKSQDKFKYDLVRCYHGLLNHIKQQDRACAVLEREISFADKHLIEIARKLDTVKVQIRQAELETLANDNHRVQEKIGKLEGDYGRYAMEIADAENMRDYQEYIENRENAFAIRVVLQQNDQDPDHRREELKQMAAAGKKAYDLEHARLTGKLQQVNEAAKEALKQQNMTGKALMAAQKLEAVTDHELTITAEREKQLLKEISELRHQVNALLVEGSEKEITACRQKEKQLEKLIADWEVRIAQLTEEIQNLKQTQEQAKLQIWSDQQELEQIRVYFEDYEKYKKQIDALAKIYQAQSYDRLPQCIYERYKKTMVDMGQVDVRLEQMNNALNQLMEKSPVAVTEEVDAVISYLRRCHNASCISGVDYLKELEDGEKQSLLVKLPYLPYAVIVYSEFDRIAMDMNLKKTYFGEHQVVLLRFDYVASGEDTYPEAQMLFTGRDPELYWDSMAIDKECQRIRVQMDQLKSQKLRMLDQEKTYRTDLEQVYAFIENYDHKHLERLNRQESLEKEVLDLTDIQKDAERKADSDLQEKMTVEGYCTQKGQALADLKLQREALQQIAEKNMLLEEVRTQQKTLIQRKNHTKAELSKYQDDLKRFDEEKLIKDKESLTLNRQLQEMEQSWKEVFLSYYEAAKDAVTSEDLPPYGDILVHFQTIRQAYEQDHLMIEDKKLLLENYEKNMARLEDAIRARGQKIDVLEERRLQGEIMICDAQTLQQLRAKLEDINQELRLLQGMLHDASANQHRLTGSLENAVSVIEEKYGSFKAVELKNMDYDIFMKEHRESYEEMKMRKAKMISDREKSEKALKLAEDQKKDLERLMKHMSVTDKYTKDSERPDANYKDLVSVLMEQYEILRKDEDLKKAEFEKDKDKLIQTLNLLKAYDLAEEIRHQVSLPDSEADAKQLLVGITDTKKIILLEKARIEKGIENMQMIKENFVRQCIQRCADMRMELEKLPVMSKITLGDEHIQMIGLRIPYIKEEFYDQKMSDYIDQIVADSDRLSEEKERLKYMQNALAWKKLFAVIVNDMNQIRLNLYKREPIREQSRFLKYEEAVGSTGQSQGIYIQFLIAVINYISAIHSGKHETAGLKKVIFIDNPFGAAKDIYIWEPIFELLRENKVQLIVPARGATPAITGKFDVNYVLGQKMIGHKQQTVVVDYHSNVTVDEIEYKAIEYEQQTFDFI